MVWINGGAFISGNGSTELTSADFLLTEDIVLVTFNYRIGVIGNKKHQVIKRIVIVCIHCVHKMWKGL